MKPWILVPVLACAILARVQESARSVPSAVAYPAEGRRAVLRYFDLDGELDVDALQSGLRALEVQVLDGPIAIGSAPGHSFVALLAPFALAPRELVRVLKKAGPKASLLEWTALEGRTGDVSRLPSFGPDIDGRAHILGVSGNVVWYDEREGRTQFYLRPGKMKLEELAQRYETLFAPYGGGTLGTPVHETIRWELTHPLAESLVKSLEKSIARLDGVRAVRLDGASGRLEVDVVLLGLTESNPPLDAEPPTRALYPTNALAALLEKEKALVESAGR